MNATEQTYFCVYTISTDDGQLLGCDPMFVDSGGIDFGIVPAAHHEQLQFIFQRGANNLKH